MAKRISDSARILRFFRSESLDKVEVVYDLVRDTMNERLAPARAAKKAKRSKVGKETNPAADAYTKAV